MEGDMLQRNKYKVLMKCSNLLELAAVDDVSGFIKETQGKGIDIDEVGFWYGRNGSSKPKMGFEERTPLMIASIYGSSLVLKYILSTKKVDVNRMSSTDGVTALHCAASGGSLTSVEIVQMLVEAGADVNIIDANGKKAGDLIARGIKSSIRKGLEMLLKGFVIDDIVSSKKEYPVDVSLPDINNELYGSDEFRMYSFKVKLCSRAYTHDWTECPFVHPGENARRRDLKKYNYTCVPCPEFRKGSCANGDSCEYAHGVFESWLHPAQYKTRLCKDETGCARKVCFFAHKVEELRPLYALTGSAIPSSKPELVHEMSSMSPNSGSGMGSQSPSLMGHSSTPPMSPSISPVNGWQNKMTHLTPPVLQQLSGSRLRTSFNARDARQQTINDLSKNYSNLAFDSSSAIAQAVMNSRSNAFSTQRSQSFIDRGATRATSPPFSQWGSPNGKLEWGFNSQDANKLKKSASFGLKNGMANNVSYEPDVSWVNTLVKDVSSVGVGLYSSSEKQRYGGYGGGRGENLPPWVEQMFIEQERLVA